MASPSPSKKSTNQFMRQGHTSGPFGNDPSATPRVRRASPPRKSSRNMAAPGGSGGSDNVLDGLRRLYTQIAALQLLPDASAAHELPHATPGGRDEVHSNASAIDDRRWRQAGGAAAGHGRTSWWSSWRCKRTVERCMGQQIAPGGGAGERPCAPGWQAAMIYGRFLRPKVGEADSV
jgi:hypothetical protein